MQRRWLLSGHNPRETFGISYPLTISYSKDFASGRQLARLIARLSGNGSGLDLFMHPLFPVEGTLYINIDYFARNLAPVLPFEPESFGVPGDLVKIDQKPSLWGLLPVPFRLLVVYRQTVRIRRQVDPPYRRLLEETYWSLRECGDPLPEHALGRIWALLAQPVIDQAEQFVWAYIVNMMLTGALAKAIRDRLPGLLNLFAGAGTTTAQLGERMWKLREVALGCGEEVLGLLRAGETDLARYRAVPAARPLLEALQEFMLTYGHRAFRYASEFEATRLADQPDLVLLTIAGTLEEPEPPSVRARAARETSLRVLGEMNPLRRRLWASLLKWGTRLLERREYDRDLAELQNATFGLAARLLSRRYFPDQTDDYLWLYTFEELVAFGQSRGQRRVDAQEIERRRADLARHRQQTPPPELIWYDPETQEWWPVQEAGDREMTLARSLQGIGASAGSGPVEGIALVTNSAQEAAERLLAMGGPVVLVTYVTDPVWSSLFRRLIAVVTEMGGVISHAAIVARENGIPAVVGVPEATRRIRDGQRVRVDGATGAVEVID